VSAQAQIREVPFDGIAIDRDAEVPIGVQLAWALRTRIGDGRLKAAQQLPGLRELAELIDVNVNTVRAVYQRLEQEGLIKSRQGSGTFVASTRGRRSAVATIAADAARAARATGVEPREVAAALYVSPAARAQPSNGAVERRRLLREQIATLERTLVEMEAKHPGVAPAPQETNGVRGPALLDAEELERVQTMLLRRLAIVQAAIDELRGEAIDEPGSGEIAGGERSAAPKGRRGARARPRARPAPAGA
jgi:DNA-binding transcriptional regulator YhcF (GntR family)